MSESFCSRTRRILHEMPPEKTPEMVARYERLKAALNNRSPYASELDTMALTVIVEEMRQELIYRKAIKEESA